MKFFYIINIFGMSTIEALNYSNSIGWTSNSTMDITNATNKWIGETFEGQSKNEKVVMNQETINEIYWDKEKIIKFLKERCLTPKQWEESEHVKEFSWEKWTRYSLILPSVNWFKCKKLDWYISDKEYSRNEFEDIIGFEEMKNWENNLRDSEVIANALLVMRDFFWALWVSSGEDIEYFEKALFSWDLDTWDILKEIANLKDAYWLKGGEKYPLTQFICVWRRVHCTKREFIEPARLFKMSVSEMS